MKSANFLSGSTAAAILAALVGCVAPAGGGGDAWVGEDETAAAEPWTWGSGASKQTTGPGEQNRATKGDPAASGANERTMPPLYSFDGGVVDGPEPGSVVESSRPGADVGDPDDGRLRIIELYEAVIKDRDAYADEVAVLSTRLEAAYQLLEQSETSGQVVKEQRDALQETIDRLEQENGELTARLTTAQIRRLEAEKMLLEIQIESYRLRQAEEAVGTTKDSAGAESVAMGGKR